MATATRIRGSSSQGRAVAPGRPKPLDKRKRNDRFGIHLRELLAAKGWRIGEFHAALKSAGFKGDKPAVAKWLRGDAHPHVTDLEVLGKVLGLTDYRDVLPPPK